MTWSMPWGSLWGGVVGTVEDDNLLTSGSWTYEAFYKFPQGRALGGGGAQSLGRMMIRGTGYSGQVAVANCVSVSGSDTITLYTRPTYNTGSDGHYLSMSINANIFDGDKWHVSFGRFRNDDPSDYLSTGSVKSNVSSSYFLRAAKAVNGVIYHEYTTSSFFLDSEDLEDNVWQNMSASLNDSGSFINVGSQSLSSVGIGLNTGSVEQLARTTYFDGKISQIRFWSKGLLLDEWREHVRNYKSLGVIDPSKNFNFQTTATGSWQRLRMDVSTDQPVTASDSSGLITVCDFSQNGINMAGTGFQASSEIIKPETFGFTYISPKYDQASTINKVRARGYQSLDLARERNATFGVVNQIPLNEEPFDDIRFSIDFSIVDALDQDIINIFATLEELDNSLGDPNLLFAPNYPGLQDLRDIYFNRLTDKINLKAFFEFFKWFDRSIGDFISALLPRKTNFRGINFVVESHMLERPKFENLNYDQYFDIGTERDSLKGIILLQQFVGDVNKY